MRNDQLLAECFVKSRWEAAIQKGVDKEIKPSVLKKLCKAQTRQKLYADIRDGRYKIKPPHEAQIPKDNGEFRTVYVNEPEDRVLLSVINDLLFDKCHDFIHPNCLSYQTGIGCGKIVKKVSRYMQQLPDTPNIGVKIDLSKYFDSVPIEYIDGIFEKVEKSQGTSQLVTLLRDYYHDDTVLDLQKQPVSKYSSLRQGCAVASFLADTVLYHIDKTLSDMNICYFRYSDDILILGREWQKAYHVLKDMLADMQLTLNPKKVEYLSKHKWFKFLGFNLKDNLITLSQTRVKNFQNEIQDICFHAKRTGDIIRSINYYLYYGDGEYCWASSVLPVINCQHDIDTLNQFVMDAMRAGMTQKKRIGGLGCSMTQNDYCIMRGTGRHVKENRRKIPYLPNYLTLMGYKQSRNISKAATDTLIRSLIA